MYYVFLLINFFQHRSQDSRQLPVLEQKTVVTESRGYLVVLGPGDVAGHELLLLSRKKGVTVYAYDDTAGPDAPESRLHSPAAPADVMTECVRYQ